MKIIKMSFGVIITLVIIFAVLFSFVFSQLNTIVEEVIETTGTKMTQTAVNVKGVDILLREGKGEINGLTIANPTGFSDQHLLTIGDIGLQLDIESLITPVKVIKQVYINGLQLRAEQKQLKDTNIQALIDNIAASVPATDTSSVVTEADGEDIRLMIDNVAIGESSLLLETENWGSHALTIPAYQQANIGDVGSGLTPEQIGRVIVSSILKRVKTALENKIKTLANDEIKSRLADEKAKLQEKIDDKLSAEEEKLKQKLEKNLSQENVDKLKSLFK